ncbi:MAG: suppressor of fused domain protein [Chloroflexi bacterium]|nr:suppressor of fused domain protein [Chloroflexota bacterium]
MFDPFKKLFGKKKTWPQFTDDQYSQHYDLKKQGLERVLGKMHGLVMHAIIDFQVGGPVAMYYFPNACDGTGFATMELIEPDGSGPQLSRIGTYELVAFTRYKVGDETHRAAFKQIELHIRGIFTKVGRHSFEALFNPLETVEVPADEGKPTYCLILDEYKKQGVEFMIGGSKHGLLLVIEVFRTEMEYAMENGPQVVLDRLKEKGYYPYSDLEREPVF